MPNAVDLSLFCLNYSGSNDYATSDVHDRLARRTRGEFDELLHAGKIVF
jgi:hypothetical protein